MPTIKTRKQTDGTTRYTAIVRSRRGGEILHRESRTVAHRSAALSWAKHREVSLEDPSALIRVQEGAPTIAELIRWYIDNFLGCHDLSSVTLMVEDTQSLRGSTWQPCYNGT